jgi:hypothetical protein
MATTPTQKGNTAMEVPEPVQFITPEEMEKYESLLDTPHVRADGTDKEYVWKVVSMHPSVPTGSEYLDDRFQVQFLIQKYHKNIFDTVEKNGNKRKVQRAVNGFDIDRNTNSVVCIDNAASQFIDSRDFLKKFKKDNS